jgi:hypothetical protein
VKNAPKHKTGLAVANSSQKDADLAAEVMSMYRREAQKLTKRHELWRKSYRLVHNRGHTVGASLNQGGPQASEIYPILAALVGWMTDQRTMWSITPSVDPHSQYAEFQQRLARDLEKCLDSVYLGENLAAEIEKILWDAFVYGTGILKVEWDAAAAGGAGNAVMRRRDPFAIFPDPDGSNYDDINYIIEARDMSLLEVERRWPDKIAKLLESDNLSRDDLPQRDDPYDDGAAGKLPMSRSGTIGNITNKGWGLPGQASRRVSMSEGERVTVYECWVKENVMYPPPPEDNDPEQSPVESYIPEWRVIVVCNDVILMNERAQDLWEHGNHPYVRYVQHDMGDLWGVSLVDHLAPMQIALNRLLAAMQKHAELCGNPVFMESANSGISRTKVVNNPGQRLIKNPQGTAEWLMPPNMASDVPNLIQFYINEMERISGLSGIARGATPTHRNSQGVMDSVQESAFVRVRLGLRNVERMLSEAGNMAAHLIVENYTIPRTVAITGPRCPEGVPAARYLSLRRSRRGSRHLGSSQARRRGRRRR